MLYSPDRKFVFVAVPKTGTTAVQQRLCEVDPTILRNSVHDAQGNLVKVPTHASARQIREAMGPQAEEFTFIAFMRDPYDVLLSKYHFYRSGRAARKLRLANRSSRDGRFDLGRILRVLSAQLLPLRVWARLYPYKSSIHFIVDDCGSLIVDHIGLMEHLQEDVLSIFIPLGYTPDELKLSVTNRTNYEHNDCRNPRLEAIVARKSPKDCELYKQLRTKRS